MDENMKLNAVATLMKSLGFDRYDKMAMMEMLKQELYPEEPKKEVKVKETGPKYEFSMLYEDGVVSNYLRQDQWPAGVIVERKGMKFAIYCKQHECYDNTNRQDAERYASTLPRVEGIGWKVITERHCRAICDAVFFRNLNSQLNKVGWRKIVESSSKEVLTSDGHLTSTKWEIWFVMDL